MAHVLVTGASGLVGSHVVRRLVADGHAVTAAFHAHRERVPEGAGVTAVALDLGSEASVEAAFRAAWPEVIVHAAALSDLRACEAEPDRAQACNTAATVKLGRLAHALGSRTIFLSTDQVFDGESAPYDERAAPAPIHAYGRTKADAERQLLKAQPSALVLRLALVYGNGPSGERSASEQVLRALDAGVRPRLFTDEVRTPVLADDVARVIAELLLDRAGGILNVAGPDRLSRHEFGVRVARAFGRDASAIDAVGRADVDTVPRRPRDLSLDVSRARSMVRHRLRPVDEGLAFVAANDAVAPAAGSAP